MEHSLLLKKPKALTSPWAAGRTHNRNLAQTNTSVTGGHALPSAHTGDSSTQRATSKLPPSHAQEHIWALKATLAPACPCSLAALGQEMGSSSSSSRGPGNPNWGLATGTLMHMDGLSHTCWPQWNKPIIPVLQAKQRQMPAGPGAAGFAHSLQPRARCPLWTALLVPVFLDQELYPVGKTWPGAVELGCLLCHHGSEGNVTPPVNQEMNKK